MTSAAASSTSPRTPSSSWPPAPGIELDEALSPAEKLKVVQARMAEDDPAAADIYSSIGAYLGHTLAYYYDLYALQARSAAGPRHERQGRRHRSGRRPSACSDEEYPGVGRQDPAPTLPDEKFRRVGQSAAAASLPELKK